MNEINVFKIAKELWGFTPGTLADYKVPEGPKKTTTFLGTNLYKNDSIGRPVFLPITIEDNGREFFLPYCVIGGSRAKIMVETDMVERDGSVKEMMGHKDWSFQLKGFLIDHDNNFPDEQLNELNELYLLKKAVRLKCALTDILLQGNDYIVIKDFQLPEKSGIIGVRDFTMSLTADNIFTLTLA